MRYRVQLEGFEGQTIEVEPASFSAPIKLWINGQPAADGPKRGQMLLRRSDGREVMAQWKPQGFGLDIPLLEVDGKTTSVVEPLKPIQWLWSGLPLILIAVGGALGAVAGLVAFTINTRLFRLEMHTLLKYVATALVSLAAFLVYSLGVVALNLFFQR